MNSLPIFRTKLLPDDIFHWMCHQMGIYFIKSDNGTFVRLPNSIHVPFSFITDVMKFDRRNIFICYLYYRIYYCTSCQYYYNWPCRCYVCTLYLHGNTQVMNEMRDYLRDEFQIHLKQNSVSECDPFFQGVQFESNTRYCKNIVYPKPYPTYAVVCAKQEPENK